MTRDVGKGAAVTLREEGGVEMVEVSLLGVFFLSFSLSFFFCVFFLSGRVEEGKREGKEKRAGIIRCCC